MSFAWNTTILLATKISVASSCISEVSEPWRRRSAKFTVLVRGPIISWWTEVWSTLSNLFFYSYFFKRSWVVMSVKLIIKLDLLPKFNFIRFTVIVKSFSSSFVLSSNVFDNQIYDSSWSNTRLSMMSFKETNSLSVEANLWSWLPSVIYITGTTSLIDEGTLCSSYASPFATLIVALKAFLFQISSMLSSSALFASNGTN